MSKIFVFDDRASLLISQTTFYGLNPLLSTIKQVWSWFRVDMYLYRVEGGRCASTCARVRPRGTAGEVWAGASWQRSRLWEARWRAPWRSPARTSRTRAEWAWTCSGHRCRTWRTGPWTADSDIDNTVQVWTNAQSSDQLST